MRARLTQLVAKRLKGSQEAAEDDLSRCASTLPMGTPWPEDVEPESPIVVADAETDAESPIIIAELSADASVQPRAKTARVAVTTAGAPAAPDAPEAARRG